MWYVPKLHLHIKKKKNMKIGNKITPERLISDKYGMHVETGKILFH